MAKKRLIVAARRIVGKTFAARRPRAMMLIEVLVAMTILSIALLAYLNVAGTVNRANKKGGLYAIATTVAKSQLELALANGVSGLTDGTVISTVSTLPSGKMTVTTGAPSGVASSTYIKEVDVTVTWSSTGTSTAVGGKVQMSTIVASVK